MIMYLNKQRKHIVNHTQQELDAFTKVLKLEHTAENIEFDWSKFDWSKFDWSQQPEYIEVDWSKLDEFDWSKLQPK